MIKGILMIICLAMISSSCKEVKSSDKARAIMKIYFTPFAIQTYLPMTMDNIQENSIYKIWFVKNHKQKKLLNLLEARKADKTIDNKLIRLKIDFIESNTVFYVDQNGVVLKDNQYSFIMTSTELKDLEDEILQFDGVIDINEAKKLFKVKE